MTLVNALRFDHVELSSNVFLGDPAKLIEHVRTITTAIHLPYYDEGGWDFFSKHADEPFERLSARINAYKRDLHVKWMVLHPPEDPDPDWGLFFKRVKHIGGGTTILLENINIQEFKEFTEVYRKIKTQLGDQLGFCFDIAHSYEINNQFLDIPEELITDLQYVHLQDTSSREVDDHLPLGAGVIPLDQVIDFLKGIQFQGVINFEIKPKSIIDVMKIIDSYLYILKRFKTRKYLTTKTRLVYIRPALKRRLKSLGTK
jgi:sugar phosphate isomerase/epimerase